MNKIIVIILVIAVGVGVWFYMGNTGTEQVPEAAAAAREQAADDADVNESEVTIVSVVVREWSDSCLGLGGIAESCLQAITPGYEVVVRVSGEVHTYRTNADGSVIREE